jgi:hypothetical protein
MASQQEVQCINGCGRRAWEPLTLEIPVCPTCGRPRLRTGRYMNPSLAPVSKGIHGKGNHTYARPAAGVVGIDYSQEYRLLIPTG